MDFRSASDINKITKALEKLNSKKQADERFWTPSVGADGNGFAVIRFLPIPGVDGPNGSPVVRMLSYAFQGSSGRWYSENSPLTLGREYRDPVTDMNKYFWDRGDEEGKQKARNRMMRKQNIANVYVVEDPITAEAEKNVFLYRFGTKMMDKIEAARKPESVHDEEINAFSLVEDGANFKISISTIKGSGGNEYRNFENSKFLARKPLSNDDAVLQAIWSKAYSLQELVSPDKFKSYDELENILREIEPDDYYEWKANKKVHQVVKENQTQEVPLDDDIPFLSADTKSVIEAVKPVEASPEKTDEDLAYFKSLIGN
jgi:gp32 DNA binding protein like